MSSPQQHQQAIDKALESLDFELDTDTYKRILNFTYKAGIDPDEPFWWVFVMLGYFSRLVATAPKDIAKAEKSISASVQRLETVQKAIQASSSNGLFWTVWAVAIIALTSFLGGIYTAVRFLPRQVSDQELLNEARRVLEINCAIEFASGQDCVLPNPNKTEE